MAATQPECEATDPPVKKSAFFYDADTGEKLGQWTLPRPQTAAENCTIHNYNMVPTRNGRYIMVGGHYQAGTWVVDFTNPASPAGDRLVRPAARSCRRSSAGAWSSYWYNGFIYESEIQEGLNVFRFSGKRDRRSGEAAAPEPADAGVLLVVDGHRQGAGLAPGPGKAKGRS